MVEALIVEALMAQQHGCCVCPRNVSSYVGQRSGCRAVIAQRPVSVLAEMLS